MSAKAWTKREIVLVRGGIMHAWLEARPTFPNYVDDHAALTKRFVERLDRVGRVAAAAYGLEVRANVHRRYLKLFEGTSVSADEHRRKLAMIQAVIAKLGALGVPEQLAQYDPTAEAPAG